MLLKTFKILGVFFHGLTPSADLAVSANSFPIVSSSGVKTSLGEAIKALKTDV
jgi:hypothetical protein